MDFLLYGSRRFSDTLEALLLDCGHRCLGRLDDEPGAPRALCTLAAAATRFDRTEVRLALAIGYADLPARWHAWLRLRSAGWRSPPLVHPRAYVASGAKLGEGCIVMASAIVDHRTHLAEACVLWPGACVNHDVNIGANTFVAPNATICGHVEIGVNCFIGAGANVANDCLVPPATRIKMGSAYAANRR